MGESRQFADDSGDTEPIIHELLIRLDDSGIQSFGSSIEALFWRHLRTCKKCRRRYDDVLDTYRRSLPADKQERLAQLALILAGKITEQFNEKRHIQHSVELAIAQGKVDPAMEAFEKVLKRHRILEQITGALARNETNRVVELAQELRLYDFENWPEKA